MMFKNKLVNVVITLIVITICSASIVSSGVTAQEIKLRERQVRKAKQLEQRYKAEIRAGVGGFTEILVAENERIDCEIKLLQARELFQLKRAKIDQF